MRSHIVVVLTTLILGAGVIGYILGYQRGTASKGVSNISSNNGDTNNKGIYTRFFTLCLSNISDSLEEISTQELDDSQKEEIDAAFHDEDVLTDILSDMDYDMDVKTLEERIKVIFPSTGNLIEVFVQDDDEFRAGQICDFLNQRMEDYLYQLDLELGIESDFDSEDSEADVSETYEEEE